MSEINLHELQSCAEDACQAAFSKKPEIGGAINWGDLGCVGARRWTDSYGQQGLTVYIEEVSPSAHELQSFIREYLADNGWKDVEVVTEW